MYVQVRSLWDRMPKTMPILVHAECYSEAYSEVAALKEACKSKTQKRKKSTESNVSDRPNSNLTKAQTNRGVYTFVRRDIFEENIEMTRGALFGIESKVWTVFDENLGFELKIKQFQHAGAQV